MQTNREHGAGHAKQRTEERGRTGAGAMWRERGSGTEGGVCLVPVTRRHFWSAPLGDHIYPRDVRLSRLVCTKVSDKAKMASRQLLRKCLNLKERLREMGRRGELNKPSNGQPHRRPVQDPPSFVVSTGMSGRAKSPSRSQIGDIGDYWYLFSNHCPEDMRTPLDLSLAAAGADKEAMH